MKDELIKKAIAHIEGIFSETDTAIQELDSIKKDILKKTSEYGVILNEIAVVKQDILEGKREVVKEANILDKDKKDFQKTQQAWALKYASQQEEETKLKNSVEALLSEEKRVTDSIASMQSLEAMKGYLEEEVKVLSTEVDESKSKAYGKKKKTEEEILELTKEVKRAKETLTAVNEENDKALKLVIPSQIDIEKREIAVHKKEQNLKIIEGRYNNKYMVKGTKFKL